MQSKKKRNKKAAIELSMTTIVVVVLSLTLLIMGFVLVRSIMCTATSLTDEIGKKARTQIDELFGSTGGEIQCIGESGTPASMMTGDTRVVWCGIRAPSQAKYKFEVTPDYERKNSIPEDQLKEWFDDANFNLEISPGDESVKEVASFVIPKNAPEGDIILNVQVYRNDELIKTTTLRFKVSRAGFVQSAIC